MNDGAKLTNQRLVSGSLNLRENNIVADKNRRIYLRDFLRFSRGLFIKANRLSYRLYNSVVWERQKFTFIQNKNSPLHFIHLNNQPAINLMSFYTFSKLVHVVKNYNVLRDSDGFRGRKV